MNRIFRLNLKGNFLKGMYNVRKFNSVRKLYGYKKGEIDKIR